MERIYFDNAATTPVDPRVVDAMLPYFTEKFGNPSSTHSFGQEAHLALNNARQMLARRLNAPQEAVIFTSGASEGIHTALKGLARARKGRHIVASSFEHSSTMAALKQLETEGWKMTYVQPRTDGMVHAEDFVTACSDETSLATLLYVQNELGTIQPIAEIGKALQDRNIAFHVDAAQAFGVVDCDVEKLHVDALTLAAHKFYGPKGVGALFLKPLSPFTPLIGGTQEFGLRAGTQNIPLAVGMAEAARLAIDEQEARQKATKTLHDAARERIQKTIRDVHFNGGGAPHILSVTIPGTAGETLLKRLDLDGIAVSTGAACSSGSGRVSHVLTAIGLQEELAQATLRLSFSHHNTLDEVTKVVNALAYHVGQIRHMNITY